MTQIQGTATQRQIARQATDAALAELGRLQRELVVTQKQLDDELDATRAGYAPRIEALRGSVEAQFDQIYHLAQPQKALLAEDGEEVKLVHGEVGWRETPPKVTVRGEQGVVEDMRTAGLERLLRTVIGIDKNAVLEEPEAIAEIKGITVSKSTRFWARPAETKTSMDRLVRQAKTGGRRRK